MDSFNERIERKLLELVARDEKIDASIAALQQEKLDIVRKRAAYEVVALDNDDTPEVPIDTTTRPKSTTKPRKKRKRSKKRKRVAAGVPRMAVLAILSNTPMFMKVKDFKARCDEWIRMKSLGSGVNEITVARVLRDLRYEGLVVKATFDNRAQHTFYGSKDLLVQDAYGKVHFVGPEHAPAPEHLVGVVDTENPFFELTDAHKPLRQAPLTNGDYQRSLLPKGMTQ